MRICFLNADQPLAVAAGGGVPEESSYAAGPSLVGGRLRRAGRRRGPLRRAGRRKQPVPSGPVWPSDPNVIRFYVAKSHVAG